MKPRAHLQQAPHSPMHFDLTPSDGGESVIRVRIFSTSTARAISADYSYDFPSSDIKGDVLESQKRVPVLMPRTLPEESADRCHAALVNASRNACSFLLESRCGRAYRLPDARIAICHPRSGCAIVEMSR